MNKSEVKRLVYLLSSFVTIILLFFGVQSGYEPSLHEVSAVLDGDTIEIHTYNGTQSVRLIGVNTPETHHPDIGEQCFGREASEFLTEAIGENKVLLVADEKSTNSDRYDRLLRHVYVNNRHINYEIVAEGYGFATTAFRHTYNDLFYALEKTAEISKKGLWSACEVDTSEGYPQTQVL